MRTAFVGTGYAAQWLHLPAVKALDGGVVVAATDPSPERRASWEQATGAPTFATIGEMLDATHADLVVVASPPDNHADACLAALGHRCHVVCEKPFVETIEQADAVLDAAARVERQLAVNQEFRYLPVFSGVKRELDRGAIGRPVFLQCNQFMDLAPWEEKVPWRAAMTDRSLFEGGVHIVDLVYWLMGGMPRTVQATTSAGLDPARKADAIHIVTMSYPNGAIATININRLTRTGTRYLDLRVDGEEATLRASHGGRLLVQAGMKRAQRPGIRIEFGLEGLAWEERGLKRKVVARNPRGSSPRATSALYVDAVRAMSAGREPPVNGREARNTLRIIRAAYDSAASGSAVTLD
jgi:D-apiose dehydrogenase